MQYEFKPKIEQNLNCRFNRKKKTHRNGGLGGEFA